jgi:hypothetical protein
MSADRPTDRPHVVVVDNDRPATDRPDPQPATNHDPTDPAPVPIEDAAVALGITVNAVRQRLKRGTLRGHKTAVGWVVVVPTDHATETAPHRPPTDRPASAARHATNQPTDQPAIAPLADLIASLSRQNMELAAASALWQERARHLEERLQALEAGPIATPTSSHDDDRPPETPEIPNWRRWLRRMTGGGA